MWHPHTIVANVYSVCWCCGLDSNPAPTVTTATNVQHTYRCDHCHVTWTALPTRVEPLNTRKTA